MLHLLKRMSVREVEELLQYQSGLLGISGISGDMEVLLASSDPRAAAAVQFFVDRVIREIGSLAAALGGLMGWSLRGASG
jgi:acetate kinase